MNCLGTPDYLSAVTLFLLRTHVFSQLGKSQDISSYSFFSRLNVPSTYFPLLPCIHIDAKKKDKIGSKVMCSKKIWGKERALLKRKLITVA